MAALPQAARRAAECFAVDPVGLGGVRLRAAPGPRRDAFLALLRGLLPPSTPWRKLPLHADDDRLLGGVDLAATLRAGAPVMQRGVLAECDGGVLVVAMAERVAAGTAARLAAALDTQQAPVARAGAAQPARLGVVALDEGDGADEALASALGDRLGLHLALDDAAVGAAPSADDRPPAGAADVAAARARLAAVRADDAAVHALCATAAALGIGSARAPLLALRTARACAAIAGRDAVDETDLACAAALVLAPRATRLPPADMSRDAPPEVPPEVPPDLARDAAADGETAPEATPPGTTPADTMQPPDGDDKGARNPPPGTLDDRVLGAARAAIPSGLLALLDPGAVARGGAAGRSGASKAGLRSGRAAGTRPGLPRGGARLALVDTLRAAAPWQRWRLGGAAAGGAAAATAAAAPGESPRIAVHAGDLRIRRMRPRSRTTTLFVVDASGSAALHRLAEAKGAVELLLADCYVRRDSVALIAFRGASAEVLLPPTRSLVRARRALAALPGGGATPLAAGIDAATVLADAVRRRGDAPLVVLLTDGRANIARDGSPGRERAAADAIASARAFRAAGVGALLVDTSPQPQPAAAAIAQAMGARYLALPHADAHRLSRAVQSVPTAGAPR